MSEDFHSLQICLQFSPKTCKILLSGQISFSIINNSDNNHTKSWQQPCNVMATSIRSHDTNYTKSWQQLCTFMAPTMQSHGNNYAQSWQQWQYGRGLCDKLSLVRVSHKNIPTSRISLICMITFAPSAGCWFSL